ncbi:MAG TPA: 3'-5' exonuclease [Epsilonproteobacteria bacterium]|nr:3'-5' exonuclease [Campylobacterota bacterium]
MSTLLSSAKNVASVRAGDKSKAYTKVFLNVKTTGIEKDSEIIQLSFMLKGKQDGVYDEYYRPKNGLSFEAMGKNRITPEMLEGKQSIDEHTISLEKLKALNTKDNILIMHNARYYLGVLEKANFYNKMSVIDTLHVAKHLLKDAESNTLYSLFFEYGLYKKLGQMERTFNRNYSVSLKRLGAYSALYDVVALKLLFELLIKKAGNMRTLIALSQTPLFITEPLRFGKYKGKTPNEIARIDKGYLIWMLENIEHIDWNLKHTFKILVEK